MSVTNARMSRSTAIPIVNRDFVNFVCRILSSRVVTDGAASIFLSQDLFSDMMHHLLKQLRGRAIG